MKPVFIGSIILTIIAAGMFPGIVVFLIASILTFVNFVLWITTAPAEEDVWSDAWLDELEGEDGA